MAVELLEKSYDPPLETHHSAVPRVTLAANQLRAVYWNVWYRADIQKLLPAIEELKADVLLLQELRYEDPGESGFVVPDWIVAAGYNHGMFVECRRFKHRGNVVREGSAIFSRLPFTRRYLVELSHGNRAPLKGGLANRRCYLGVKLDNGSRPLELGLAHLSYVQPFSQGTQQEHLALEKILADKQTSFIFGGDLNVPPESSIVYALGKRFSHCGPGYDQTSWVGWRGFAQAFGRRLDYAFRTPDLEVVSSFGPHGPSDHLPIVLDVSL